MSAPADSGFSDQIFREARTFKAWRSAPVSDETLRAVWADAVLGPTSMNCCPARVVFVRGAEAKERLKPCLASGNVEKTMAAPVTAVIGHDLDFPRHLGRLNPHAAKSPAAVFEGKAALIESTAFRNGTLQGAYLMIAARAHGLDCGPMSGFDAAAADAAFFAGTRVRSNFLCNLGYGAPESPPPRAPRPSFEDACRIL